MRRTRRWLAVAVLFASLLASPASAQDAPRYASVVIVLAPYLSWDDLTDGTASTIAELANRSALANANVRNGSADAAPDGLFGAGVLSALRPLSATEAAEIRPGEPFGALGGAVRDAGGATVAIGTAMNGAVSPDGTPALVVAADTRARVNVDATGERMLLADPGQPLGVTVDRSAIDAAYRDARASARPLLIVVDPGELERARAVGDTATWAERRVSAVRTTDLVVELLLAHGLPENAALIVVSTASYAGGATPGYGPVILYADGPGVLESPATRRRGIVTLADVGVTALDLLGIDAPVGAAGAPLGVTDLDRDGAGRIAMMTALDVRGRSLEAVREPVWFGFIGICVAVVLAAAAVVVFGAAGTLPRLRRALAWALVVVLAIPPGSLISPLGGTPSTSTAAWVGLVFGTVAVLALVFAWPRRDPVHALGRLLFITLGILLFDQLTGGYLSNGTALSYSTLFGARYYGLGNEGAAIAFGALLAGIGWRIDHYGANRAKGFLVSGALVIVISVLPFLGANLGVAAWGAAAVVGGYLYAARRRFTWRIALAAAVAVAAVIGLAALAERLGAGSHLGGLVRALEGGGAGVGAMLARKVEISVRAARATPLVVLLPLGIGAMAYLVRRPVGRVGAVLVSNRGLASAWVGTVAAAVVAVVTEDSAVAIGALLMLYAFASFGVVALAGPQGEETA